MLLQIICGLAAIGFWFVIGFVTLTVVEESQIPNYPRTVLSVLVVSAVLSGYFLPQIIR